MKREDVVKKERRRRGKRWKINGKNTKIIKGDQEKKLKGQKKTGKGDEKKWKRKNGKQEKKET